VLELTLPLEPLPSHQVNSERKGCRRSRESTADSAESVPLVGGHEARTQAAVLVVAWGS
jgi:hypothetical protein